MQPGEGGGLGQSDEQARCSEINLGPGRVGDPGQTPALAHTPYDPQSASHQPYFCHLPCALNATQANQKTPKENNNVVAVGQARTAFTRLQGQTLHILLIHVIPTRITIPTFQMKQTNKQKPEGHITEDGDIVAGSSPTGPHGLNSHPTGGESSLRRAWHPSLHLPASQHNPVLIAKGSEGCRPIFRPPPKVCNSRSKWMAPWAPPQPKRGGHASRPETSPSTE